MPLWWPYDLARCIKDNTKSSTRNNSLPVSSTWLRGSWEKWNRHNRMMPRLRRTRERVVVPLATNEPSPVVQELSINAPSVSAEMVVHCEDSTERRAPPSMVVEKTRDIHTDELSFLNNQSKQSHPRNSMSLWKCRAGVTWRNYVSIISHGWGNTFRKVMMKSNRKTKKSQREGIYIYSLTLNVSTYLSCTEITNSSITRSLKRTSRHGGSNAYWKGKQPPYAHCVLVSFHMCQKCKLHLN